MNTTKELGYIENGLSSSWFVENPIDFEHKLYVLMSFIKNAETNINNGYWFPEFTIIEERYKDLCSFIENSKISMNKSNKPLFDYIYDLPNNSNELLEINKIILLSSISQDKSFFLSILLLKDIIIP